MFSRFRLRHITTHHRLFPRLGCSSLVLFFCVDHLLFAPRVDFLCCVSVLVLLFPSLAFLCLCALLFCPPHSFLSSCSSRCPSCRAPSTHLCQRIALKNAATPRIQREARWVTPTHRAGPCWWRVMRGNTARPAGCPRLKVSLVAPASRRPITAFAS